MSPNLLREKMEEEIEKVPEEQWQELLELIQSFRERNQVETPPDPQRIMRFAGCWNDMSDDELTEFLDEIYQRRANSFRGREEYFETLLD